MDSFKLVTRTSTLSVYRCPQCFEEFVSRRKARKCPKCRYPAPDSDFVLALKRAKTEIRSLIAEKGYILQRTELQPILDTLLSDFPKTKILEILGALNIDRDKIRRERYDIDLHEYVEVTGREEREEFEEGKLQRRLSVRR